MFFFLRLQNPCYDLLLTVAGESKELRQESAGSDRGSAEVEGEVKTTKDEESRVKGGWYVPAGLVKVIQHTRFCSLTLMLTVPCPSILAYYAVLFGF